MRIINLSGIWKLTRLQTGEKWDCLIPGDNISALTAAGAVLEPYFGMNERKLQWIGAEDWNFTCTFDADEQIVSSPNTVLEFPEVDTVFEARLNGRIIGRGRNGFILHRFDITGLVELGTNTIEVIIQSPERAASEIRRQLPYPVPHAVFPVQSEGRNLLRKIQCHSGWDWGPCLMVSGIYGMPVLKAAALERIEAVYADIVPRDEGLNIWRINVKLELFSADCGKMMIEATCLNGSAVSDIVLKKGSQTIELSLEVSKPELWWPAGYGEQPMYELRINTANDSAVKKIGFRKAEVLNTPDDFGTGMKFRVNNRDIFCRGANWIPVDALPAAWTETRYKSLIDSAAEANMNMLRVWGGGRYELDIFYDYCDEKGIMIWQDFMFSCSMYPADDDFLDNVKQEAEYQLKRLKNHPSLMLWCGNNEDVGALNWFEESKQNRDRYIIDYDRLNEGVLGKTVKSLDPGGKWWPSSPSAGEGDYSDCWHDDSKGDMHYWSVWHEGKPFEAYREVVPRFCSEFGFQSFTSVKVIKSYAENGQHNITSPVMEHHQRNDRGNSIIINTISDYYRFPEGFGETVYLSRIQQAEAIKTAVEYWRSKKPVCMGMLYWQLNDTWPGSSWSSLDYDGGWKPLHYSAKKFYAPLLLTLRQTTAGAEIIFCNDSMESFRGRIVWELRDFDGTIKRSAEIKVDAAPENPALIDKIPFPDAGQGESCREAFIYAGLYPDGSDKAVSENTLLLDRPKRCNIKEARLAYEITESGKNTVIILTTDKPAFNTVLEHSEKGLEFSDNNITLLPGRPVKIHLTGNIPDRHEIEEGLSISSLRNFNRICSCSAL